MSVRPTKTQISLGICSFWSDSSLCSHWVANGPWFLHADSEDADQTDQTGRMPRLIWVFAGRTVTLFYHVAVHVVLICIHFYLLLQNVVTVTSQSQLISWSLIRHSLSPYFIFIATYITWETDLNKALRLLADSQFVNSVVNNCVYLLTCKKILTNMFKLKHWESPSVLLNNVRVLLPHQYIQRKSLMDFWGKKG